MAIKKTPSDYPLISIRIRSKRDKEKVMRLVERLVKKRNAKLSEGDRLVKRVDCYTEALIQGLESLLKKE